MLTLDTNVIVAFLQGTLRSNESAALNRDGQWAVSAIVLWELEKLHKAGRIRCGLHQNEVIELLREVTILPLTVEIARASQRLDFESDPADELIAATSIVHRAPLVTRDSRLLASRIVPLAVQ